MRLLRENCKPIQRPSDAQLARSLRALRSYGPSSFAVLECEDGGLLQVAGGGMTCLLEKRAADGVFRAWQEIPVLPANFDGATLVVSVGEFPLARNEWFTIDQIIQVMCAFAGGLPEPEFWKWCKRPRLAFRAFAPAS